MTEPSEKLSAAEMERVSIELVEKYARNIGNVLPDDRNIAIKTLRQNIRDLVRALAKLDGNHNTSEFLGVYSVKYSTPALYPGDYQIEPRRFAQSNAGDNVVQCSELFRNAGRAK